MKKLLLVLLSFLSFTGFAQTSKNKDIEAVRKTFQDFRAAVLNKDGALAIKQVDAGTVKYYGKILDWTWYADTAIIDTLNVFDRLAVLNLRHRVTKDRLLQLRDAKDLIKLSIDSGYLSENSVKDFEIGDVELKGNVALGQARVNGKDFNLVFKFIKEQETWKLQLAETLLMARKGMEKDMERQRKGVNEYVWTYLILESGKNVAPEIIEPLKKR